jgi:S-formylglutathione hydrolase FrmB
MMPSPFPNQRVSSKGKILCVELHSTLLQNNYWNDPSSRELWVYTPPGYNEDNKYPVVVFLAGFAGTGEGMFSRSLTDISLASRCDAWIKDGCAPFIAVFPDCMTTLGGSQYVDSPAIGKYASYIVQEVIPFVSKQFSTTGKVGVAGRSSGGYGAMRLAMEHPNTINGVACHAGDMGFQTAFLGEITAALLPLHNSGSAKQFLVDFWKKTRFSSSDFAAFNLLCMSASYSPNLDNIEFPADIPLEFSRGEVKMEIFERWFRHDPIELINNVGYQNALKSLDYLFIDVGRFDEYNLQFGARRFVELLQRYSIEHIYEEFDGGHRGTSYRYDNSIPKMIQTFTEKQ